MAGVPLSARVDLAVHLLLVCGALAAGLRTALRAIDAVPPRAADGPGESTGPAVSWYRHRVAQLLVWLVGGALVGGFAVRSGVRLEVVLGPVGPAHGAALVAALLLALGWGLLLGLLFPPTWLTTLAGVQLRVRDGLPLGLVRRLADAHDRGEVGAVDAAFVLPLAPAPARSSS